MENQEKKSANEQGWFVWIASALLWSACCFFLPSLKLWRLLHFNFTFSVTYQLWKSTLHEDNHTSQCIYGGAEEQHWHMSTIDGQVRQAGTRWADIEFSPPPGSLAVRKIKCHADDSRCQNRNYLETLLWNTSNTSGWSWLMNARTSSLKRVFEKPFYYYFWLILYIIFSQILFQCFINRKDCKYK